MDGDHLLGRLADLAVTVGANVQLGQILAVAADHAQFDLTRAIADSAYRHGARFVDVQYFDPYVKRARIAHADEKTLDFVPSWFGQRVHALGTERAARISLAGPSTTGVLDDLDPGRAGRDQLPFVKEIMDVINERTTNWSVIPCPSTTWARLAHPDLPPEEALDRLWHEIAHVCRLDEPDPAAAWNERADALTAVAARMNERHFDALQFEGPGTGPRRGAVAHLDLLRRPRRDGRRDRAPRQSAHGGGLRNAGSRTDGGGRPLDEAAGPFGRFDHPGPGGAVRGRPGGRDRRRARGRRHARRTAFDEGAARLGEVALVDGESRIGRLGTVFFDTLLDENAASHIALGDGFDQDLSDDDQARRNRSSIHIDFMIGDDDVAVTGITREGGRVPVLRGGAWQI